LSGTSARERNFVGSIHLLSARSCAIYASASLGLMIRAGMAGLCEEQSMAFGATGSARTA
jgi:hypothetical protein